MRYFRYSIVIILFITLFISTETSEAASGDTYEVGSMLLHVRDEPAGDAAIIGLLHKGDKVTVFQEKYGWVQTYYSGEVAWIAKHHLIPTANITQGAAASNSTSKQITISESSVNIRSGPGLDYSVVAGTKDGEYFTVIDRSGDWLKIKLANENTGWVASWLTTADSNETSNSKDNSTSTKAQSVTQTTASKEDKNGSLAGYNIVLDAGHGGRDPGAIGLGGIFEKDLVATTTSQIATTLRAYGATVIETRTGDYFLSLDERTDLSNVYQAHAFISVHFNAFPVLSAQGINTFHVSDSGRELGASVHNSLTSALPLADRGLSKVDYKVLRNTDAPSILMELGFITNAYDLSVIRSADYPNQVAEAVANGLMNYFH